MLSEDILYLSIRELAERIQEVPRAHNFTPFGGVGKSSRFTSRAQMTAVIRRNSRRAEIAPR